MAHWHTAGPSLHRIHPAGYDLHASGAALVFRQSARSPQHPDTPDRFWHTDFTTVTPITAASYLQAKFGPQFAAILAQCEREPPAVAHGSDGTVAVCDFADAAIRRFDAQGRLQTTVVLDPPAWTGGIYGIALGDDLLWLALPTDNVVLGVTWTGQVVHTIPAFQYPEHLARYGQTLYVSAMGDHALGAVDLSSRHPTVVAQLNEPLWEYVQYPTHEVVRLQSGIYHRLRD